VIQRITLAFYKENKEFDLNVLLYSIS